MIIAPEFRLVIYSPYAVAPWVVDKGIKSISSTRTISGDGSASIEFAGTNKIQFLDLKDNTEKYSSLAGLLQLNTVISVQVKTKPNMSFVQINLVYVDNISWALEAAGQYSFSVTLPTLDKKFREAELFIDYTETSQNTANQTVQKQTIELSLTAIVDTLKNYKEVPSVIKSIWDDLIVKLMQVDLVYDPDPNYSGRILFGGKNAIGTTDEPDNVTLLKPEIMPYGITTDLIQIFDISTQVSFGQTVNFWSVLSSALTEPFYELFIDPLETIYDYGYIGNGKYDVPQGSSKFVFRMTPLREMFATDDGEWNEMPLSGFHKIKLEDIKHMDYNISNAEIYSGVHVGLSMLDTANMLIVPVKWNNVIRGITNIPKVLQVKLSGLGFEPNASSSQTALYGDSMRALRDQLYRIFFEPSDLKIGKGSIATAFDFYRVGKSFLLEKQLVVDNAVMPKTGYIVSVTDRFTADGKAMSLIQYKWASYDLLGGEPKIQTVQAELEQPPPATPPPPTIDPNTDPNNMPNGIIRD